MLDCSPGVYFHFRDFEVRVVTGVNEWGLFGRGGGKTPTENNRLLFPDFKSES